MEEQSYLIFRLNDLLYGIPTAFVKEIFQLPEITPIPEAPPDIIGILNLRGEILPVMHLERRLGQTVSECTTKDTVIVMEWQMIGMGITVNEVLEVQNISHSIIETEPDYGRNNHINTAFISGIAKIKDRAIILINSEALIRHPDEVAMMVWEQEADSEETTSETLEPDKLLSNFYQLYCPQAGKPEKELFRQRAKDLRQPLEDISTLEATVPLAVFSLGEEYFALDLDIVKEFIDTRHITLIPCCPNYIVGNINLRGQIITVVDLCPILQLDSVKPDENTQIMVIEMDDIKAGILVNDIFDVLYLDGNKLSTAPTAVASEVKNYVQGTASYEDTVLTRIDLVKILEEERLVVN